MNENRKCGDCTACCEGWLSGTAHGHDFYPGKPCHFIGCNGCTIYPNRPIEPCVNFKCVWLDEDILPEWMQPHLVNVIVQRKYYGLLKDKSYLYVTERGIKIDSTILSWFFMYHVQSKTPLAIQVDRGWNYYGPEDFLKEVAGVK